MQIIIFAMIFLFRGVAFIVLEKKTAITVKLEGPQDNGQVSCRSLILILILIRIRIFILILIRI